VSRKVLIVDDEPDVARYLAMVLRANGFSPVVADSVESGLKIVDELEPDLVCLDIMMPRESGISMYRRLRQSQKTRRIPVIIISGAEQEVKFDFRAYLPEESIPEPDCYMEKPIDVEKYLGAVERLIGSETSAGGDANR